MYKVKMTERLNLSFFWSSELNKWQVFTQESVRIETTGGVERQVMTNCNSYLKSVLIPNMKKNSGLKHHTGLTHTTGVLQYSSI